MPHSMNRRTLMEAAAGLPWLLAAARSLALAPAPARRRLEPFPLADVRLKPGAALEALGVNRRYLLGLDPERLLHMFRVTAGLPSTAAPLGGWEAPSNELRGHFTGHCLSALALLWAQTGDGEAKARAHYLTVELARCQAAIGSGYLSAFPPELFDRLRLDKPAWAPFYTLHKIMAGLFDVHALAGDAEAWPVLERLGAWVERWVQPLGEDAMARVLEREYGGMSEVLYNMADASGEARWRELGGRFHRERILKPLAAGIDELKGLHVNTTVPQIIGAARGYELTGDAHLHAAAEYFWHTVTERRCYATGGSSNEENWNQAPGVLSTELSPYTQECCVTYNLQKLTRHVFEWTGDARAADYYERAYYNGILGVQHPADGAKLYYVPLAGGYWKMFGTPLYDFWCCTGSMAEAFAKLGDSIYFRAGEALYVNLFAPSELHWRERGLTLVQDTRLPEEPRTRFTVRAPAPVHFALHVRVPGWAAGGSATLNGARLAGFAEPSSYFVLERTWRDGDRLEVELPMRLHAQPLPDDPEVLAVLYGPLVLAARLGTEGLTPATLRVGPTAPRSVPEFSLPPVKVPEIRADAADPASWLEPVPGRTLEFRTRAGQAPLALVPFNRLYDERYAVYFTVRPPAA